MTRTRPPRRAPWKYALMAVAIATAIAVTAWYRIHDDDPLRADASDPALVVLGTAVYGQHCASCHGRNLEGAPDWRRRRIDGTLPTPPHDATGHTWHHSDHQLFRLTKEGPAAVVGQDYRSAMPGFAGVLGDREIWASLAYIKSRWPPEIRDAQAKRNGAAR